MNDSNKKKKLRRYRHLSDEERYDIIGYMDQGMSFRAIGRRIGRSASTVEREARRGLVRKKGWQKTPCPYLGKKGVSVCNQCRHKTECFRSKVYYHAAEASEKAYGKRHALRRTRTAPELVKAIDAEVDEGTDKGQSIEYIQHFYPSSRKVSVATIRRWIIQGRLSVSPIRLRRRRAYRKKYAYKRPKSDFERLCALKAGHTMREYRIFRREHPEIPVIELDSVEGKTSDERSILTIMFVSEHFQYGRVYSKSDGPSEVAGYLRILLGELSDVAPGKEFVFLADNGIEFDGLVPLEKEFPFLHVFYASPYRSTDKAHCERNHEKFRYVVPKGISLDGFSQEDIDEMFSDVDSYATKATGWKRPCELLAGSYSPELLSFTGVRPMSVTDVNLRPKF